MFESVLLMFVYLLCGCVNIFVFVCMYVSISVNKLPLLVCIYLCFHIFNRHILMCSCLCGSISMHLE